MAIHCPNCGVELPDGVAFCDVCGTPLRGQSAPSSASPAATSYQPPAPALGSVACPVCGTAALPGEAFCDNCGAALLPANSYAPQAQPQQMPAFSSTATAAPQPAQSYAPAPAHTAQAALVVTSPPPPATLPIPGRSELIVGRSDPQSNSFPDVDLGPYGGLDLGVSRRHFRITRTGDQFYVEDLNAMNGTVVNGTRLTAYTLHPLRNGDRITLGKMELRFELS